MPDDPANARARSHSRLGLSRELQQNRTSLGSDPSIGGTRGYPYWFRIHALVHAANHGVAIFVQVPRHTDRGSLADEAGCH